MSAFRAVLAVLAACTACGTQPRPTASILSPTERNVLGCYRVTIATRSSAVPAEFDMSLDTLDGLNGRRVRLLSVIPDSVVGLGFFWSRFGDSLRIGSWGGREGQGLHLRVGGGPDTLVGSATWYWHFDRSDRDDAPAALTRRPCP
jgi:hypothetical protein